MSRIVELLNDISQRQKTIENDLKKLLSDSASSIERLEIHNEVLFDKEIGLQVEMSRMKDWKNRLKGVWIAIAVGSVVFSTIAGLLIAYYKS